MSKDDAISPDRYNLKDREGRYKSLDFGVTISPEKMRKGNEHVLRKNLRY